MNCHLRYSASEAYHQTQVIPRIPERSASISIDLTAIPVSLCLWQIHPILSAHHCTKFLSIRPPSNL